MSKAFATHNIHFLRQVVSIKRNDDTKCSFVQLTSSYMVLTNQQQRNCAYLKVVIKHYTMTCPFNCFICMQLGFETSRSRIKAYRIIDNIYCGHRAGNTSRRSIQYSVQIIKRFRKDCIITYTVQSILGVNFK